MLWCLDPEIFFKTIIRLIITEVIWFIVALSLLASRIFTEKVQIVYICVMSDSFYGAMVPGT